MHYYQHHIGDFIKDTSYLTNEEVGIYLKLLWIYYDTEQPLPDDLFQLSMKANARDNERAVQGILEMFFELQDGEWRHHRCDREIQQYHSLIENASKAGRASAEKRALAKQSSNDRSTDVQLTMNQEPITNNQEPIKAIRRATQLPADFQPTDDHVKLANDLGILVGSEFDKFKDYCTAKGQTYKDWNAAFRNWLRNARAWSSRVPQQKPAARHTFDDIDYGESRKI